MNTTAQRSLGVALVCAVLLVVAVIVNQLDGPAAYLDLLATLAIVVGLGALLVTGIALARRR